MIISVKSKQLCVFAHPFIKDLAMGLFILVCKFFPDFNVFPEESISYEQTIYPLLQQVR